MNPITIIGIKALAVVVLLGALVFGWKHHEATVYERGHAAAIAERKAADDIELAKAIKQVGIETKAMQEDAEKKATERQEEKVKYEATINDLRTAARRGNSGMRNPDACVRSDAKSDGPSTASGPSAETGHDLLPETADTILDTAAYIRQSVLDRNALIDKYEMCRTAANKGP